MKGTLLFSRTGSTVRTGERRTADAHRMIGELMLRMGIEPHLVGFEPLCDGVRIAAEQERTSGAASPNGIYPAIGDLCETDAGEHAIRDAIGVGFLNPGGIHAEIFPFSDRPSNFEFICTVAELVRDRIKSGK